LSRNLDLGNSVLSQESLTKKSFCGVVWSRNLDKNAFTAHTAHIEQGKRLLFMKRKTLAVTFVWALLFSVLAGALVNAAAAEVTVYVRANGSVEGTDKIQRDGDLYILTGDLAFGIQVERSNIVFDGSGYTLQGDGEIHGPTDILGMGLEIIGCRNVTVRNLTIKGFTRGIRFTNAADCHAYHNRLVNNTIGVEMGYVDESYSNNNTVSGNLIKENDDAGIRLIHGSSNTISENIITANDEGISIWGTSGNTIAWNNITRNKKGVYVETSGINIIHHNNFVDNTNDWWDYGLTPWPIPLPFSTNKWDDGEEGNYWSNYTGVDMDGDGIGDIPYELYENNTDNYPLMKPVTIPESIEDDSTTPTPEPFPTALVLAVSVVVVAVVGAGLLFYSRKRKREVELS
jgi:parallel beta-helix repeat protein